MRALLARARALASAPATAMPEHPMYASILRDLDRLSSRALPDATGLANSIADGLGVLAARELESATGQAGILACLFFSVPGELDKLQLI